MPSLDMSIHRYTPVISVQDPRALTVRMVQFKRRAVAEMAQVRVTQQIFDAMGRSAASRDPRLFALAQSNDDVPANLVSLFSLSGAVLFSDSVDAGWRLALYGEAGQALERWDGRETHGVMTYDALLRPLAITEQDQVIERFTYAAADAQAVAHNLCGQLARHDDPAGRQQFEEYSIGGALLQITRRFLQAIERPNWPVSAAARDELLEPLPGAVTRYACSPWAEAIGQTDAQGNIQRLEMTCAGALRSTHLQLAGQAEQVLFSDIRYNAFGQVEAETAGNGVQTRNVYDPATGRLQRLTAHKTDGTALQDLNYEQDPFGNILRIEDTAQPTRYFRNQVIEAVSTYRYDTLYQLIEATGREALDAVIGPQLPPFQSSADPNQLANYTQHYDYDAGGNLLTLNHIGGQQYTRQMIIARYSNRSLPVVDDHFPDEEELAAAFDANGNLLALQRGQALTWDVRNQLQQVTPVQREEAEDDHERYSYDGGGQRVRKVRITQAANTAHRAEVRYLPGLEVRTDTATGQILHAIKAPAGRCEVRVLHWLEDSNPEGIANDQVRYSFSDHLGSSTLELDDGANVISLERYYPFGGTSWWAGRSAVEAKYKTVRYSGKERDATGLYYYGLRYYAPWLCRWINPDPAGMVDGLNRYSFVTNSPINLLDENGCAGKSWKFYVEKHLFSGPGHALRGRDKKYMGEQIFDSDRIKPGSRKYVGVNYLNQGERESTHVTAEAGRLFYADEILQFTSGLVKTSSRNWHKYQVAYVLGLNESGSKELFVFKHEVSNFHHSTPFAGKPVLDAGMMTVAEGGVAYIENKSGHYKPNMEQKLHTLQYLKDRGFSLKDTFVSDVMYHDRWLLSQAENEMIYSWKLFNAEDFYNFHMEARFRSGLGAQPPAVGNPPPHPDVLDKTGLEFVTYRNWKDPLANARPRKHPRLKVTPLLYKTLKQP